eukprot:symbB.v1.2.001591.t1/scaffold88.1/size340390/26
MAAVSGHDHRSGFKACCTAALRLFGITPVIVLILVLYITLSAIFTGWIKPAGLLWNHGYIELALFCLEVSLLLASYFTAVIRGPGYVPFGWKPTEEALRCDLAVEILQWHGSARLQEAHGHRGKFHGTLQQRFAVHPFRGDVWHLIIPVAFGGSRRRRTQVAAKMDIDGQLVQKELFDTVQELWAVRVPNDGAYRLRQVLSMPDTEHLLLKQRKEQGIFNVVPTSQGIDISEEGNYSLLLLASEVSRNDVPNDVHQLIASFNGSFTRYSLVLNYDSFSYKEVLSRLLPSTVTVPCGYEIVGHVAHFNLQEQHWPYRFLIGQVCLDKRHCVKTVIAKQGIVSSEFRTFDMEVIAGQADTLVSLKEHGLKLQFDFRKVYWNSRLSAERGRIAAKCGKSEVMLDLCCGVGALSLLCARKGCLVIANDLNPAAILFAQQNAKLNKLNITTLCTDAQELLHATLFGTFGWEAEASTHSTSRPPRLHIVFNLPELALQILCDELRKAIDQHHVQLTGPTVDGRKSFESGCVCSIYCYTFGPSQSAVSEHLKLLTDLPEMQRAAKIRQEVSKLLKESGLVDSKELPLKIQEIPVNDLLQWCANCNGYKPPRAHHCSSCSRCVLSMDHHCPWTNTCVGQINLKAFVQFVHYVPVATFHSFVILSELPALLLYAWQKARKTVDFFQVLLQIQLLLGLIAWFASLAVMLLVGTLAWDNMTMIEEYVVEKAEIRRRRNGEKRFVFPYDLGKKGNTAAILGSGLFSWLLPGGATPGDPVWPNLRSGSSHFDISIEQIAQKTEKLHRSVVMPVRQAFSGEGRCCFTYWCWVGFHFGCAVCDCEACGEPRLTVAVGEAVLVAKSEGSWAHGRSMINSERNLEVPSQPGGWLPRQCLNERAVQPYQIPFQKELQGRWEVDNVIILYAIQNQETLAVAGTFEAMARPRLPSAALHRHADKTPKISCCGVAFEDCEADDFPSCRSWDRTRTPDASPEEIIGGRFELLRSIGRGGAATMHQGKCLRTCTLLLREMCKVLDVIWTGQLVAIKSIPQESREDRKAALGEAAFLRSLDHEGVNRLVAVVEDEFCIHLILEYAKGTDLMETLLLTGPMEEEQAAGIIRQIVEVLAYCHSHGVVHRDVKPENIMISGEKPEITLVDFGLAMDAGKEVEEGEDEGTPVYLAPEVRNKPLICDGALDMFSLGVVLFAMLSGQLPARQATPELAKLVLPEISAGAGDFLARLLVEPELRLSAAEALEHPWLNAGAH